MLSSKNTLRGNRKYHFSIPPADNEIHIPLNPDMFYDFTSLDRDTICIIALLCPICDRPFNNIH
jgi:hypothetical protein